VKSGFWVASRRHDPDFGRSSDAHVALEKLKALSCHLWLQRPVFAAFMNKTDASAASQTLTKELVVQNKMGIHARPAAMVVRITNKFKAEVFVEKDEEQVNGKSIMGLMMLAAGKGSKVKFIATGNDAPQMLAEIEGLFARKFDEA
jgi:phosphocarrier protein